MIVDPTTRSRIFNPISAQGQWLQHRWGMRRYPDDVSLSIEVLNHINSQVNLFSVYGDPLAWQYFNEFCESCTHHINVETYGVSNMCKFDNVHYAVNIDGIDELCGKVFLGAEWDKILGNLDVIDTIIFHVYAHNQHQLFQVKAICKKHNVQLLQVDGHQVDNFGSSIVDGHSNWLYDIFPKEHGNTKLIRTVPGYNNLCKYLPKDPTRSILNKPMLPKSSLDITIEDDGTYIAPTGHVFYNHEAFSMFMMMLCDDWDLKKPKSQYEERVLFFANQLATTLGDPVVT